MYYSHALFETILASRTAPNQAALKNGRFQSHAFSSFFFILVLVILPFLVTAVRRDLARMILLQALIKARKVAVEVPLVEDELRRARDQLADGKFKKFGWRPVIL
jgi:hypothetical protein